MQVYDIAVVGSGIGGSLIAALNKEKNLILFEKDGNLGGCASCFTRYGVKFNTGATTFAGYDANQPLRRIANKLGVNLDIKKSEIAIRCLQDGKSLDRSANFEEFLKEIDQRFPNKNNEKFWREIFALDKKFWELKALYYAKYSFKAYILTLRALVEILKSFGFSLFCSASSFIKKYLGDISKEYQDFIDAQLLITVQATSKQIPLLSLALGLSYPFHEVYFANKGMGDLVESFLEGVTVKKEEEILSIVQKEDFFELKSSKNIYHVKKVVLNSTVYDASKLFNDEKIKNYYKSFSFNDQSAFTLYLHVKSKKEFLHHYQILHKEALPNTISNSFFISFWRQEDSSYSVTISTHTKAEFWVGLSKEEYKAYKSKLQYTIMQLFLENFRDIAQEDILKAFSATSKTFSRYIGRKNCGGGVISFQNLLSLPSCTTPFKGLYNVGDSVFAGQGWPGVALGVEVLHQEINR